MTCLRAAEVIESENVSMRWVVEQHRKLQALCQGIERLPASEQQTSISLQASEIAQEFQRVVLFDDSFTKTNEWR